MANDSIVFIVESAYACPTVMSCLRKIGVSHPKVYATLGRLYDVDMEEYNLDSDPFFDRREVDIAVCDKISSIKDSTVYIATDDDAEGELIAADARRLLLKSNNSIFRVRLSSYTPSCIEQAIKTPSSFDKDLLHTALARRSFDLKLSKITSGGGRIMSRHLLDYQQGISERNLERMNAELRFSGINTVSILAASSVSSLNPSEVSRSLQKLYSQGRITYPRTLSGIPESRNDLVSQESHGQISITKESAEFHGDTPIDGYLLRLIKEGGINSALTSNNVRGQSYRCIMSLYSNPFLRASTVAHHIVRSRRLCNDRGWGITRYASDKLAEILSVAPSLSDVNIYSKINRALLAKGNSYKQREGQALSLLSPRSSLNSSESGKPVPISDFLRPDDRVSPEVLDGTGLTPEL